MLIMKILGLKDVIPGGLICINDDNLEISKDTVLTVDGSVHVHNYYKLEITKFMSTLLLVVVLGYFSL